MSELRQGTKLECSNLFSHFNTEIVKKALTLPNDRTLGRGEYIKSVIKNGIDNYRESTQFGPDDRCVTKKYHIQLFKAEKPEEIAEYIISGLSFEIQREMFSTEGRSPPSPL